MSADAVLGFVYIPSRQCQLNCFRPRTSKRYSPAKSGYPRITRGQHVIAGLHGALGIHKALQ